MRVAVVIPVFNHGASIAKVITQAQMLGGPVIVVDDGSTDQTPDVLTTIEGITVLRHPVNQGKGAALQTGFAAAAACCDWVLSLDGDGQHCPADGQQLIAAAAIGEPAIVIGCRQGMVGEHVPWTSRFGRGFSNFWVWVSGGPWVHDSQSGFRLYPLPEVLHLKTQAQRYQWEVEVLVQAHKQGLPIVEVPVSVIYQPKGERISHFRPWVDFWRNAQTFTRLICTRIFLPGRK